MHPPVHTYFVVIYKYGAAHLQVRDVGAQALYVVRVGAVLRAAAVVLALQRAQRRLRVAPLHRALRRARRCLRRRLLCACDTGPNLKSNSLGSTPCTMYRLHLTHQLVLQRLRGALPARADC